MPLRSPVPANDIPPARRSARARLASPVSAYASSSPSSARCPSGLDQPLDLGVQAPLAALQSPAQLAAARQPAGCVEPQIRKAPDGLEAPLRARHPCLAGQRPAQLAPVEAGIEIRVGQAQRARAGQGRRQLG